MGICACIDSCCPHAPSLAHTVPLILGIHVWEFLHCVFVAGGPAGSPSHLGWVDFKGRSCVVVAYSSIPWAFLAFAPPTICHASFFHSLLFAAPPLSGSHHCTCLDLLLLSFHLSLMLALRSGNLLHVFALLVGIQLSLTTFRHAPLFHAWL